VFSGLLYTIFLVLLAFIVLDLVFLVLAKRLAGKNISKMTYFCLGLDLKP